MIQKVMREVIVMAIRCDVFNCKYNKGGWCKNDYIEIKNRICQEYEPK